MLNTEKSPRLESVLRHDYEVNKETRGGLDESDLAVCHGDESCVDKFIRVWIPRLPFHDVCLGLFVSHGDSG